MTFDLERIEEAAKGVLLISTMRDGEEIVFCGEVDGEYVGWTPREFADLRGYSYRADPNPELLALVEVVRAAREVSQSFDCSCPDYQKPYHPRHHPNCLWDEGHDLRAALEAFA